ncbi:hypothetical protein TUM12147_22320 [Citrobacter europaeus]|jgi:hypothetical protein|nr:hypothetical protein TUM12147_22320 [Citrobacter europaeus]GIZ22859.1 hypothetical protein TUM12148_15230 [Citrobacter europaeus]
MYTFPNTGDVVISSCALVTNFFKYCHGQSTVSFDPGAEARVFILVILRVADALAFGNSNYLEYLVVMPILACK